MGAKGRPSKAKGSGPGRAQRRVNRPRWQCEALREKLDAGPQDRVDTREEVRQRILDAVAAELDLKLPAVREGQGVGIVFEVLVRNADGSFQDEASARTSPEANAWRREVFERDDYTCRSCGVRGGKLHAHHVRKWSENPDDRFDLENGVTLCTECHAAEHPDRAALIRKARYHRPKDEVLEVGENVQAQ